MNKIISKSKYINGLQCPRYLWIACNEPGKIPQPNAATQHIFDQGHIVGELAKKLFPGGIDVPIDDFNSNLNLTKNLVKQRKPLFEAGILSGRMFCRSDILNPVNEEEWDLIEVKSSTSVKEVYLHDVSYQKLCWEASGKKIRKCFVACINNQYVKNGEIVPELLFTVQDVTDEVAAISEGITDRVARMFAVIDAPVCPEVGIGPHCKDPYDCPMTDCWEGLPEHSIFTLYYGGKKAFELYDQGIISITEIPIGYKLNERQSIQCSCVKCGEPYTDKDAIQQFLQGLKYPLYFLDFETFATAIPLFDGTRPYQNIPFQFSLHIQESLGSEINHFSFLAEGHKDPRLALLTSLSRLIGNEGTVIAYNKSFEENILVDLGAVFTEYDDWITDIVSRLQDLMVPFRSFNYYHPSQKGSTSLKSVLPAVTGQGYEGLDIAQGNDASLAFLNITYGNVTEEEKRRVRANLEKYCGLDTEGMVRIINRLEEICK